jgi:hypothetical protein
MVMSRDLDEALRGRFREPPTRPRDTAIYLTAGGFEARTTFLPAKLAN